MGFRTKLHWQINTFFLLSRFCFTGNENSSLWDPFSFFVVTRNRCYKAKPCAKKTRWEGRGNFILFWKGVQGPLRKTKDSQKRVTEQKKINVTRVNNHLTFLSRPPFPPPLFVSQTTLLLLSFIQCKEQNNCLWERKWISPYKYKRITLKRPYLWPRKYDIHLYSYLILKVSASYEPQS